MFKEGNGFKSRSGAVVWFTGLSGAGKSTLAHVVQKRLDQLAIESELLDGDEIRKKFPDLGFSKEDRNKQVERVAKMAAAVEKKQHIAIVSLISPYREARLFARRACNNFLEIYLSASLEICLGRDTKGLYQKAIRKELTHFTGISDPYEVPEQAELEIDTGVLSIEESVNRVIALLKSRLGI